MSRRSTPQAQSEPEAVREPATTLTVTSTTRVSLEFRETLTLTDLDAFMREAYRIQGRTGLVGEVTVRSPHPMPFDHRPWIASGIDFRAVQTDTPGIA